MTGDGVNDAPALKKADCGIAVAGATDAAKSAAAVVLTKPGLSVIIDAVTESRKIFQRMTNYAIYRINETFRVLFFISLSIIVFQLYPVTALMIVLLALLNDMPIMTIAYDNVKISQKPEKWNMRTLLTISSFLGAIGTVSSFGLLIIGLEVLHLNPLVLQSFIYLKLSVAGHLAAVRGQDEGTVLVGEAGQSLAPRGDIDAAHGDDDHRLRNPPAGHGLGPRGARLGVRAGMPSSCRTSSRSASTGCSTAKGFKGRRVRDTGASALHGCLGSTHENLICSDCAIAAWLSQPSSWR